MQSNPVGWFEIYVSDMDRAKQFYESVLSCQLSKLDTPLPGLTMWAFPSNMERYGVSGSLVKHPMRTPNQQGTLIYFSCQDCAVEAARIEAAGGVLAQGKTSLGPYGFMALGIDTEGNAFGLHSM